MSVFPFHNINDKYDKPVNTIIKPLDDELAWDRVKKMFTLEYVCLKYKIFFLQLHTKFLFTMVYNYNFIFQRKWIYKRNTIYHKYNTVRFCNWLSYGWDKLN